MLSSVPIGLLYVADTWNRRISVFNLDGTPANIFVIRDGQPSNNFRVRVVGSTDWVIDRTLLSTALAV